MSSAVDTVSAIHPVFNTIRYSSYAMLGTRHRHCARPGQSLCPSWMLAVGTVEKLSTVRRRVVRTERDRDRCGEKKSRYHTQYYWLYSDLIPILAWPLTDVTAHVLRFQASAWSALCEWLAAFISTQLRVSKDMKPNV